LAKTGKRSIQEINKRKKFSNKQENNIENIQTVNQENKQVSNSTGLGLSSIFSILPSATDISPSDEPQSKPVKKKKKKRGIKR
jgi:hypothetical protein